MKTLVGVALFVIGLLIGGTLTYAFTSSTVQRPTSSTSGLSGTITLGELADFTGGLAAQGTQEKLAADLAISDINSWLKAIGAPYQFQVKVEDDATDPATALQNIQLLASLGIKAFIGPDSSGEASNILTYANTNHLILVSGTASSPSLAIANDSFFRVVIPDTLQGKGLAAVIWNAGFRAVILVYRNDAFGTPIATDFQQSWQSMGGTLVDTLSYTPVSTGSYDFGALLAKIDSDYKAALSQYGKVAIEVVSTEELGALVQQAEKGYPELMNTQWFGSDGAALSSNVLAAAGPVAAKITLLSTSPVVTNSSLYNSIAQRLSRLAGAPANQYAIYNYDATWVLALSIISCGKIDYACLQQTIPIVADHYFGATGWTHMDANGDRDVQSEGLFEVVNNNGVLEWAQVGVWDPISNTITYFPSPVPA